MCRVLAVLAALACAGPLGAHPDIDEALSRLNDLVAAAPDDAQLYRSRGDLYARHEDWTEAEASYLRAAELAPDLPGLDRARAVIELATGRADAARAHLNRALTRDPADAEALILRARAGRALGRNADALADFNAGLARLPTPAPELFLERAALLPSPAEAIRSLDEGLALLGPVPALELRALALEESLGRTAAALTRLDRLAGLSERKEWWLKRRGDLLVRAGRAPEAQLAYSAALHAITTLPAWLRESPDTAALAAELTRLTSTRS